jgi:hypothetical protein
MFITMCYCLSKSSIINEDIKCNLQRYMRQHYCLRCIGLKEKPVSMVETGFLFVKNKSEITLERVPDIYTNDMCNAIIGTF